jgi:hypothetical protein
MPIYGYTIEDILWGVGGTAAAPLGGVWSKLATRSDLTQRGIYEWATDAILELSRNFRFPGLERSGPVITFNAGQTDYTNDYLIAPADAGMVANLLPSFVRYFNPYNLTAKTNSSSCLQWKTVDALELMFNTQGVPCYFTRYGDIYKVAPVPDGSYAGYLRYQVEHPFTNSNIGRPQAMDSDIFFLPNDWKLIVEFAIAEQGAIALRMMDYASQYHQVIFGDPEFERSSGGRGNPGMIFRRISQMEGDSESMPKSLRVAVNKP